MCALKESNFLSKPTTSKATSPTQKQRATTCITPQARPNVTNDIANEVKPTFEEYEVMFSDVLNMITESPPTLAKS